MADGVTRKGLATQLSVSNDFVYRLVRLGIIDYSIIGRGEKSEEGDEERIRFSPKQVEAARYALDGLKWLAIVTPENWQRLCDAGLRWTLLNRANQRTATTLRPGNFLAFYVTKSSRFVGTAEVSGPVRKERTMWPSAVYSYVVPLKPSVALKPTDGVDVRGMLEGLSFIQNKERWSNYFFATIRLINDSDYAKIESAVETRASSIGSKLLALGRQTAQ